MRIPRATPWTMRTLSYTLDHRRHLLRTLMKTLRHRSQVKDRHYFTD